MPVKLWNRDDLGNLTSTIRSSSGGGFGGEEYRSEAEELDKEIDCVLDRAAELADAPITVCSANPQFVKRWAIGRAIAESGILQSPHLASEPKSELWLAMARKCRIGVRASGEPEKKWRFLIPERDMEPRRIENDIFGLGMWLQEQELDDALSTFGGGLHNAKQIWSGEPLRAKQFKNALGRWFAKHDTQQLDHLYRIPQYAVLAKSLRRRWPSRGPGSAKRPAHYDEPELYREIRRVLDPIVVDLLQPE